MNKNIELYNKYFAQSNRELLSLFQALKEKYAIKSAIYPGSFVHITPAFVFPETAFIDNDRRIEKFFSNTGVLEMVKNKKEYSEKSHLQAFQQDYAKNTPLPEEYYDLLISQYAGFVSQACKKYLKIEGILLVNNSHADAGLAHLDDDYELVGVANHTNYKWRISEKNLADYFIPKKSRHPSKKVLLVTMKGIGYTKTASNYIFKRVA